MRLSAHAFASVVVILHSIVGQAIFADEAYENDYHHALFGLPQSQATFFHRPSPASKASLLFTLSERLVLGAVNPKDGSTLWRQQVGGEVQNRTSVGLLRAGEGGDTLVTARGKTVESWNAADGRLIWQQELSGEIKSLEITESERDVIVLSEAGSASTLVQKLAAESGAVLWEYHDTSGDLPHAVLSSRDRIFYLSLHSALMKGFKIKVTELSSAEGALNGHPILLNSESEITSRASILHLGAASNVPHILWADKAFKSLKFNILGQQSITHINPAANDGKLAELITIHAPGSLVAKPHLLVHYQRSDSHWAEVYHCSSETASKAYDLPSMTGRGTFSSSSQGSDVYFTRNSEQQVILTSSETSDVLSQWNVRSKNLEDHVGSKDIVHAVSEVVSRGSSYAVRSALLLASGDWELVRNGDSSWARPEGLTGIVAAAFVEVTNDKSIGEELAAESQSELLSAYVHRVRRHIRDLKYLPPWIEGFRKRALSNLVGTMTYPDGQTIRRDSFGFRKLVIVATEHGRLAALDIGSQGKVIWNIRAVSLNPKQKWKVLQIEAEGGVTLVRAKGGEFLQIATDTGAILRYQPGGTIPSLRTSVALKDNSGETILVPLHDHGLPGQIPKADFARKRTLVTRDENQAVNGWSLSKGSEPELCWRFTPAVGEHVIAVSARPLHDPVASIGKALGDRGVLYKYLNPNSLLITAVDEMQSVASFYILDASSGAVLYSTSHPRVDLSRPIASVMSENWFVYTLFSTLNAVTQSENQPPQGSPKGYQLVVSELYESPYPNDRGSLASASNVSSIHPLADDMAGALDVPHVISQTFLTPGPISSVSVTSTLQGITTRSLLCVLPDLTSIISMSRAFVDARRPVGRDPTAMEAEEGLFRYSPSLEFEPKWVLNHRRDIMGISKAITSPSLLESTSLVFAFGRIDLFGTRTAPIGAFDMLGKGFSKLQLVLTVVALAVGTLLVAPFVRRKQIDTTWKA